MNSLEAARQAYRNAHLRLEREDPLIAAISAYLETEAEIRAADPLIGPFDIRTLLLRRLAAAVSDPRRSQCTEDDDV